MAKNTFVKDFLAGLTVSFAALSLGAAFGAMSGRGAFAGMIGAAASLGAVIDFSDAMIFAMVFPNMIGLFFLFPKVKEELSRYLSAIKGAK